ncbi:MULTISPECIES: ABC transporter permease [unclassified Schlesneria]|uniref:ABC transporter permease n=1 Tax=Schlesneria TaxID=656899 RepID=UPI002EF8BA09
MAAWYITAKDLFLLSQDRQALVLLLVLPLLFISIVGMSTGQFLTRDDNTERFRIALIDRSQSETSKELISSLGQQPELLITPVDSEEAATELARSGDAIMLMQIGPRFEELVDEVRMTDIFNPKIGLAVSGVSSLDVTLDAKVSAGGVGKLLEGVVTSLIIKFVAPIAARKNPVTRGWVRTDEEETTELQTAAKLSLPDQTEEPKSNAVFLWVVPGFTVMFAFFLVNIMARSFMIERDQGTLRRLLMAPIGTASLLIGKTIPFYLTSILQCGLLFLCGRLLFGMPWGSQPAYLIPVILCTSAAAASLGLLLATLVQTDQQISSYGTTLILVLSSVSGCFFPRELFPKLMKQISLITPHAWSLKAFDAVLTQPVVDPQLVATCCGMLLFFAAICFTTGWWRFRSTAQG